MNEEEGPDETLAGCEEAADVVFVVAYVSAARSWSLSWIRGNEKWFLHSAAESTVPVVANSRSLFTNAFLFSSRSWLGIKPALPPSMWQACKEEQTIYSRGFGVGCLHTKKTEAGEADMSSFRSTGQQKATAFSEVKLCRY